MLQRTGIRRIQEGVDGAEALGCIAEARPDLVIWIGTSPSFQAGEVIADPQSRNFPCSDGAPLLMMAQPQKGRVERAVRLGVNEVIAKPFSPKTLWSRLDEIIQSAKAYETVKSMLRPLPRRPVGVAAF